MRKIYAYTTPEMEVVKWKGDRKGKGLIKVGQTIKDVEERIKDQFQGSPYSRENFKLLFTGEAVDHRGETFNDHAVFKWLKALGAYRVPNTEWFECTIGEVKEAFNKVVNMCEVPLEPKVYLKFTKERGNTGMSSNKKESDREKALMKNPDCILEVLKRYPEASSAVKLAPKFVEHYDIKQHSVSSVSIEIGYTIRDLVDVGLLKRNSKNELSIVDKKEINCKIIKPKITVEEIKSLLKNSPEGITVRELRSKYDISNCRSYVYEALEKYFKKVEIFDETLNRYVHKYIDSKYYEVYTRKNVEYTEEDIDRISNFLKNKGYGKSNVVKETGLPLTKIKKIVKENFPELRVSYQSKGNCYYMVRNHQTSGVSRVEVLKLELNTVRALLEGKEKGMQTTEMSKTLNISKDHLYRLLNKLIASGEVYMFANSYILSKYSLNPWFKKLPMKNALTAFKYGITGDIILGIIRENPNCSSSEISKILHDTCNAGGRVRYFDSLVAAYKRLLVEEYLIVLTTKAGNMHIKDEEHKYSYSPSRKWDHSDIVSYIGKVKHGASLREIHSAVGGSTTMTALYGILDRIPELEKVKIISTQGTCKYVCKWFVRGEVNLAPDEEFYEAIMF